MLNIRHAQKVGLDGSLSTSTTFGNNIQFTSAIIEPELSCLPEEPFEEERHLEPKPNGVCYPTPMISL